MTDQISAKVAFMIIGDDPTRVVPGLTMATRLKLHREVDVRVLFFGPGVKLAASGQIDEQLNNLQSAGIGAKACQANVEQYNLAHEVSTRPLELLAAGAEVMEFALQGYTVISF